MKPFKIQSSCVSLKSFLNLLSDDFLNASFWSREGKIWLSKAFTKIFLKDIKDLKKLQIWTLNS